MSEIVIIKVTFWCGRRESGHEGKQAGIPWEGRIKLLLHSFAWHGDAIAVTMPGCRNRSLTTGGGCKRDKRKILLQKDLKHNFFSVFSRCATRRRKANYFSTKSKWKNWKKAVSLLFLWFRVLLRFIFDHVSHPPSSLFPGEDPTDFLSPFFIASNFLISPSTIKKSSSPVCESENKKKARKSRLMCVKPL